QGPVLFQEFRHVSLVVVPGEQRGLLPRERHGHALAILHNTQPALEITLAQLIVLLKVTRDRRRRTAVAQARNFCAGQPARQPDPLAQRAQMRHVARVEPMAEGCHQRHGPCSLSRTPKHWPNFKTLHRLQNFGGRQGVCAAYPVQHTLSCGNAQRRSEPIRSKHWRAWLARRREKGRARKACGSGWAVSPSAAHPYGPSERAAAAAYVAAFGGPLSYLKQAASGAG